jgi:NitT/TauT family transport system permease protein
VVRAGGQLDTTGVFAGLFLLMLLAMIANQIIFMIEQRALHWRRGTR